MKYFCLIALIVTLASCENPSDCTDYYFSDQYKSYIYANPGSYWIYEDSILGIIDSLYIDSQSVHFNDICAVSHQPEEELKQHYISSYFKGEDNNGWTAYGFAVTQEYQASPLLGSYSEFGGQFIDSMMVHDIWYKNILEFKTSSSKYYWSENIGLIKKEFSFIESSDTVYHFELISYSLNN